MQSHFYEMRRNIVFQEKWKVWTLCMPNLKKSLDPKFSNAHVLSKNALLYVKISKRGPAKSFYEMRWNIVFQEKWWVWHFTAANACHKLDEICWIEGKKLLCIQRQICWMQSIFSLLSSVWNYLHCRNLLPKVLKFPTFPNFHPISLE